MFVLYVFLSVLMLCIMIAGHEFGHYIVAKKVGCTVSEFSIGFGPKVFQRTCKDGMKFSLRVIPIGGFCKIEGENVVNKTGENQGLFCNKKPWQQIVVLLAGIAFNLIFGFLLCVIGYVIYGLSVKDSVIYGAITSKEHIMLIFESFKLLFNGSVGVEQVSGVVGCVEQISQISASSPTLQLGLANFFVLMGFISTNLGVVNAFPIPALDGGRAVLVALNKISQVIRHKPLSEKAQQRAIAYTIIFAFCLMGALAIKDIMTIFLR